MSNMYLVNAEVTYRRSRIRDEVKGTRRRKKAESRHDLPSPRRPLD